MIAANREYGTLKERVVSLAAEWEGLMSEAEWIDAGYRKRQEELAGQQLCPDYCLLVLDPDP